MRERGFVRGFVRNKCVAIRPRQSTNGSLSVSTSSGIRVMLLVRAGHCDNRVERQKRDIIKGLQTRDNGSGAYRLVSGYILEVAAKRS